MFYQVDINVVKTQDQHDALIFYNSYGDLGLILSLFVKPIGLGYSRKGLKVCFFTFYSSQHISRYLMILSSIL